MPGTIRRSSNYGIRHDLTQWGDQASVTWRTGLAPGIANALVVGLDANLVRFTHENDFGSVEQVDAVDPFAFDPGRFLDTQGIAPRYRTRTTALAVFAEDRVTLGPKWSVVGGVRYEVDTVRRWTVATPDRFVLEKTFRNATWRAGLVYQPVPTLSLYAQYATGVDPLGTLTTVSTGQVQFSNARGHQVEAGAKWLFANGHGTATLAAYRIVKTGLLAQRTLASPVEQVGQRSSQGVEAAVTLDLPQASGSTRTARCWMRGSTISAPAAWIIQAAPRPTYRRRWPISGCAGMPRRNCRRAPGCVMSGGASPIMAVRFASRTMRRWTRPCPMR